MRDLPFKWLVKLIRSLAICIVLYLISDGQQKSVILALDNLHTQQQATMFADYSPMFNESLDNSVHYAEGWKKGTQQVQEQKIIIRLSTQVRVYERTINDAAGQARYKLKVEPALTESQESSPKAWTVDLIGPDDKFSLLQPDHDPNKHQFTKADYLSLLYPVEEPNWRKTGFMGVPLSSKRVIKVEGFYCIIQVRAYRLSRTSPRAFESLEVEIEFTNKYEAGAR